MKTAIMLSLALAVAASGLLGGGCARPATAPPAAGVAGGPIPDTVLGLARGSVFDVPTPPVVKANTSGPGEEPALPRAYVLAPPRIPHGIADFPAITAKENACVGCHETTEKKPGEPTPIPSSHYIDFRNAPGQVGATLVGSRQVCVSCHVSRTDAPSLIESRFGR